MGLEKIVQEIVGRPGWVPGNALVLMIKKDSGNGSRGAYSFEAQPENAPVLVVTYDDPKASVGPQDMAVCMPPSLNANLGGKNPMQDDLQNDCQYRVGATFGGLAEACNYPSNCGCVAVADTKTYSAKCDDPCVENPVAPDCKNFDPVHNVVEATNAPGDNPVCIANCPLSFGMFGRRSECLVEEERPTCQWRVSESIHVGDRCRAVPRRSVSGRELPPSVWNTISTSRTSASRLSSAPRCSRS